MYYPARRLKTDMQTMKQNNLSADKKDKLYNRIKVEEGRRNVKSTMDVSDKSR